MTRVRRVPEDKCHMVLPEIEEEEEEDTKLSLTSLLLGECSQYWPAVCDNSSSDSTILFANIGVPGGM